MLELENAHVSYGELHVLREVSFSVTTDDDVVAIVGPNGAGKTTLLRALSGILPLDDGRFTVFGDDGTKMSPDEIVKAGFVHVPEELELFTEMSVLENLEMGAYTNRNNLDERLADVYEVFPVLKDRSEQLAGTLSGGEQQMLAIGRGLMVEPSILALDEPSTGLAPQIAADLFDKIEAISGDITVVLVEQHVSEALRLASRAYLLEQGTIALEDTGDALLNSEHVRGAYLR